MTRDEFGEKFNNLLTDSHNAAFDCGEWDNDGSTELAYQDVLDKSDRAESELRKFVFEAFADIDKPQHGECNECGKKQTDGFALYCVQCADSALIGCQYPLCKSKEEQHEAKDEAIRKLSEALRLSWSKMYVSGVEARRLSDEALQLPIVRAIAGESNAKP